MKNIFIILALFFSFFSLVKADEKVPVYIIAKEGCVNCDNAIDYFKELDKKHPDLFEVTVFEVFNKDWDFNSSKFEELYKNILTYLDESTDEYATPVIIIGDYYNFGLPKDRSVLLDAIEAYQKEEQTDPVSSIIEEMQTTVEEIQNSKVEVKEDNHDGLIMLVTFGVIVLGFIGLLVFPRK